VPKIVAIEPCIASQRWDVFETQCTDCISYS